MQVLVSVRRVVARRPWVQWAVIVAMALGVAACVADAMAGVEAERAGWGRRVSVWVATGDAVIGEPLDAELVEVPAAVRPPDALASDELVTGLAARQSIGRGEMIVAHDVMAADDTLGLAPSGWLVVPIVESPPSGAAIGERVQVASDGFVVASDGIVVGFTDAATLVAVPADVAPLLPLASATSATTLLRWP